MREAVIADLVPFGDLAAEQIRVSSSVGPDHEERGGRMLGAQDVEDGGGESRIGPVIERQRDLPFPCAVMAKHVWRRQPHESFGSNQAPGWVEDDFAPARLGLLRDLKDLPFPFVVEAVTEADLRQPFGAGGIEPRVTRENPPDRRILRAQPPECDPAWMEGTCGRDLVESGRRIQEPDAVGMLLLVAIGKGWVQGNWVG